MSLAYGVGRVTRSGAQLFIDGQPVELSVARSLSEAIRMALDDIKLETDPPKSNCWNCRHLDPDNARICNRCDEVNMPTLTGKIRAWNDRVGSGAQTYMPPLESEGCPGFGAKEAM